VPAKPTDASGYRPEEANDSIGPMRVAAFLKEEGDELRADVVGFVDRLLRHLGA
jgi:hypothetical protein